ncbi:LysR family transcriptional regulator [Azospirillum sp. SYSU D00513]|uniref:LysR family transcriptional regulator n=1 Tax=Azospirillum sp. SYSU D00513 TaxID=2812561 RepID=UPI001A9626C6|nr:LysR family transcriptional regulator [Azospirillum sp. SYSU D00513]
MTDREPSWDLYRTFLAVLEEGSLSGAARALGVAQPTIGRHIDALEQSVGFPLFTRSQHGLAPTEAALELRPYAEALSSTAAALLRAAGGHGAGQGAAVKGTVRVTASEVIGVEVLPPILAALRERHPALSIELALSNAVEDLLRRDADIAVRMVEPVQDALLVRRLGTVTLGLHAHRRYLDRQGRPERIEDLAGHSLIGFDRETPAIRALRAKVPPSLFERSRFALRADSDLAQLAAIRAGFGIGVCQVRLAERDPDLVRLLPEVALPLGTWLAMHENLKTAPRCRAVFDALATGLEGHVER